MLKSYRKAQCHDIAQLLLNQFQSFIIQICYIVIGHLYYPYKKQLMESQKEMHDNFNCIICLQLAKEAVETVCCGQIMCHSCSAEIRKRSVECPNCRNELDCKPSIFSRRMISSIKIQCNECGKKIYAKEREEHQYVCLEKVINCKYCGKDFKIGEMIHHMQDSHENELIKMLVRTHTQPLEDKDNGRKSQARIFQTKIKNSQGNLTTFGSTGKYYCGKRNLIGKCGCCDGRCGPTNGQNCDACMELDLRRYNLDKGFLVNPSGYICKFEPKTSVYYCGRNLQGFSCSPEYQCKVCKRVKNSVVLGRYSKLI